MSYPSREYQFWHDTIRKIVVSKTRDKKAAENVITQVTDALESWKAQGRITKDFGKLKMMDHLFHEQETEGKTKED
jgi:hypothetical protein